MQLRKKIPFFDLNRQYEMIKDKVNVAVYDVLCSGQVIEGPAVKELEKKLGEYLGVKSKSFCHREDAGVWHKPVWIWIVDKLGGGF